MKNDEIIKKVNSIKRNRTEELVKLTEHMVNKNIDIREWNNENQKVYSNNVIDAFKEYFNGNFAKDKTKSEQEGENSLKDKNVNGENRTENDGSKQINSNRKNAKVDRELTISEQRKMIRNEYRLRDNLLIDSSPEEEYIFEDARKLDEESFSIYLTGGQLATLFTSGQLFYDATMQRGVKTDKNGEVRANFKESHINEIAQSIEEDRFATTQLQFVAVKDEDEIIYDGKTRVLSINGRMRIMDGQHRTRAFAKVHGKNLSRGKNDDSKYVDLNRYIFNVKLWYVTADRAREIYNQIDKNWKLDKSQVRQLQNDIYAKLANKLNNETSSPLHNLIASSRPVKNRVVLFSNVTKGLEDNVVFDNPKEMLLTYDYLIKFFEYVMDKIPEVFSLNEKRRIEFRERNLLGENSFFPTWLKVAFIDKDNYKKNIDIIAQNISMFDKRRKTANGTSYYWIERTVLKYGSKAEKIEELERKPLAMNNSDKTFTALNNVMIELLTTVNQNV